jgi:acyl-CoA oxidase
MTVATMPDFTDALQPAEPSGPMILAKEREQSDVPVKELSEHLLSGNGFLERQARILPFLEKDPLFSKARQQNLSRPERYHLGLARGKKLRRLVDQQNWSEEDHEMAVYLCDDVSPYMVHVEMFITTIEEQGNDEQREYWLPKVYNWDVIGCYAQ